MTEDKQIQIFTEWMQDHKSLVYKILRAYTTDPEDMDDLFQEISVQLWRSVPGFRGESAPTTWIYRIALNTAIKWIKKEQRQQVEQLDNFPQLLQRQAEAGDERLEWLYAEIHQLDKIDRSLTLLMLDGFTYKEMAALLGITATNVGVKITRIKKHLLNKSKQLQDHGI